MKKFAVIGNPIAHSRSPDIHAAFAASCGIELSYERVLCELDGFVACINHLRANGFSGANVTVPFKQDAFAYATDAIDAASWAGCVSNTLTFYKDGVTLANNTDGFGLVNDIVGNLNVPLKGKNVLLLGSGGAARGVLPELMFKNPAALMIAARDITKVENWLTEFNDVSNLDGNGRMFKDNNYYPVPWFNSESVNHIDVVINATSSGLSGEFIPPAGVVFNQGALAYDMMYGKPTEFLAWASSNGARTADGWGMLVEQAAKSFEIWHGVAPDTRSLIASKGQ